MKKSFYALVILLFTSCAHKTTIERPQNDPKFAQTPIVLLISIDGYRDDYNKIYQPPFLSQFAQTAAGAQALLPSFPTNTFPNHYTLVTGLYPDNHGIIGNIFYDPNFDQTYSLRDATTVTDGRFYGGVPLWSLASAQGMVNATYFWPGSEAKIADQRPHYYLQYDHHKPHTDRIKTVLEWLSLPANERPHFVTLYFSDVDSAGHAYGPNSPQVGEAVQLVDQTIATLVKSLEPLNLDLNIVIVSDHGMAPLSYQKIDYIDDYIKTQQEQKALEQFRVDSSSAFIFYYYQGEPAAKEQHTQTLLNALKRGKHFKTYRRGQVPAHLNFNKNERMGDLLSIAKPQFSIGQKRKLRVIAGGHGFDPTQSPEMAGIFWAQGPSFAKQKKLTAVENIHLYPLLAHILNLKIEHPIDGKLEITKGLLKAQ